VIRHAKASFAGSNQRRASSRGRFAGLSLALALIVFAFLAPSALAAKAHIFNSSFGPGGPGTHFGAAGGTEAPGAGAVAVDSQSHAVYVVDLDEGAVSKFDEEGNPVEFTAGSGAGTNDIGGFSFFAGEGFSQIAVNPTTHVFYVADGGSGAIKAFHEDGEPAEFTAGPAAGTNEITSFEGVGFGEAAGVAVDANEDIYIGNYSAEAIDVYASTGEEITSSPATEPANVAVDSLGAVYVNGYWQVHPGVEKFIPSAFPVTPSTTYSEVGVINSGAVFAIAVDRSSDDLYVNKRVHSAPLESQVLQYDEEGQLVSSFAGPGEPGAVARSEGVAVDEGNGNVYVSDSEGETAKGQDEREVEIFAPPPPIPPSVGSTTATNVTTTSANLHAQVNPNFFATRYHFEYLSEAEYQANGETFAGAKSTAETDLGSSGKAQSANAHAGGLAPDTAYRFRVIAENENGEATSEPAPSFSTFAAFPPGLPDGRAYEMISPSQKAGEVFAPEPEGELGGSCIDCLPGINNQMAPMQSAPDGEAVAYQGQPFSGESSSSPNEYLSGRGGSGWGTQSLSPPLVNGGYRAFSADLSRAVLFQIAPTLSPQAPSRGGESFANLYLRGEDGSLQPLVTTDTEPPQREPGGATGSFQIVYAGANSGTETVTAFSHALFAANDALTEEVEGIAPAAPEIDEGEENLYEWVEGAEGELRLVNVLPDNETAAAGAVIGSGRLLVADASREGPDVDQAISEDGSRIFWSDEGGQVYVRIDGKETVELEDHTGRFLTASPDGSKALLSDGCLYDLEAEAPAEPCEDLTEGQGEFEGILGASEDLSSVYFVDSAVLPGAGENQEGEEAQAGKPNLYSRREGATSFIATLLASDNKFPGGRWGDWRASRPNRTAQVSPDGRYLAFMSQAQLSGYDNELSGGGECRVGEGASACTQVFEYDAATGSLGCASCDPSGQRPLGASNLSAIRGNSAFPPFPQPGNLSTRGQGRLFFESEDVLSPYDTNGHIQDIYEWEPNGVGSCKRAAGCVFLISSGHAVNDSMFLDSSDSGSDAFFVTREQLALADRDDQLDLYDARVGSGFPAATETLRSECQGEACQPAAILPNDPTPSSSAFHGAGNVNEKPKRKHHKKKHKRHAKKHSHKRASNNRGGAK
jgi:DNA-binding beta-propeller fold protein YncE